MAEEEDRLEQTWSWLRNDQEKEHETCWLNLPYDILNLIFSNLCGSDCGNFRQTCRWWRDVTTYFPPPVDSTLSRYPYLMSLKGSNCKFFQPLNNVPLNNASNSKLFQPHNDDEVNIPELEGAVIRCSSWGWLLMSEGDEMQFFFNPTTKELIELPDLPEYWSPVVDEYFTCPPTSSYCTVLAFREGSIYHIEFAMIKRGEDDWTIHELENNRKFKLSPDSFVMNNEKLYCLGDAGNIGELDMRSLSWNILTKPLFDRPSKISKIYMVNCDGGILVVILSQKEEREVRVKRCKLPEMTWEDINSLKDEALYLSHGGSFLVKAPDQSMSNKIFFPMFYGESGVFYSLKTKRYHSIIGKYSSRTWFGILSADRSTWIQASHEQALPQDLLW